MLAISEHQIARIFAGVARQDHSQGGPRAGPPDPVLLEFEPVRARSFVFGKMIRTLACQRDGPKVNRMRGHEMSRKRFYYVTAWRG